MKKFNFLMLLILIIFLLPYYCLAAPKKPVINSISPTIHESGSMTMVIMGKNFNRVSKVVVFDASSGRRVTLANHTVNSPDQLEATVNLKAGFFKFRLTAPTGISNFSPTLVVTAPEPPPEPAPAPLSYFSFNETTKRLTIDTPMMELGINAGAIVYVRDKSSGEVLIDSTPTTNFPTSIQFPSGDPREFIGFTSKNSVGNHYYRRPSNDAATFTLVNDQAAKLTYSPLYRDGAPQKGTELVCYFAVDVESGEVVVTMTGTEAQSDDDRVPFTIDMPIMNFMKSAVISSMGRKLSRTDSSESLKYIKDAPAMAVAEGDSSVLAAWSECSRYLLAEHVRIVHDPAYDHLIIHMPQDEKQNAINPLVIVNGPWRIGTYTNWLAATKRWRVKFEERTRAKPLWENTTSWVRNIHAVYTNVLFQNKGKYDQLASLVPVAKLLYFVWNGDRIVLFGDHTYGNHAWPPNSDVAMIKSYGWRLMLYHPWTLIYSYDGALARLGYLASKGWLPNGYIFNPDYAGHKNLSSFLNYWSDVDGCYSSNSRVLHPATVKFRDYLVQNYSNYCTFHNCDACYYDILGADENSKFETVRKVINGEDYALGEKNAIAYLRQQLPDLPVMSEYIVKDLIPFVFYTWEGSRTLKGVNHPFRTALIGSYIWCQGQELRGATAVDYELNALVGALPQICLAGDYAITDVIASWTQAQGKLFCSRELFNDLPPSWDPQALAYYRSNNGNYVKFKKLGEGQYAYIEELPGGGESILLNNSQ